MARCASFIVVCLLVAPSIATGQVGTAFIYQGRLSDGDAPANGVFDFQLILYTAPAGGSQVGDIVTADDMSVDNGVFATSLDFGPVFTGARRWLEIGVRPGGSTGIYSILSPRQELTPTPHALYAATATTVAGLTCTDNQVAKWNGNSWTCGTDDDATPAGATAPLASIGNNFTLTSCGSFQIYKMNASGTAWACSFDVDTNTTYSAGSGLDLIGTQFSVNSSVARKDGAAGSQGFDVDLLYLDYVNDRVGIGTSTPSGPLQVFGGTAAADNPGLDISMTAEFGGADGADTNDAGGSGGRISFLSGSGGPGRSGGDVFLFANGGGTGTPSANAGPGGDLHLSAGLGGGSALASSLPGSGGTIQIIGGLGGSAAGGQGTAAGGGAITITGGGGGGPNGSGGQLTLNGGNALGSGVGGTVRISAGGSSSAAAGDITLVPGVSLTGVDGVIELGGTTANANTSELGAIAVHVVGGDMNVTNSGRGIILRSPNGTVCRRVGIDNSGNLLITTMISCP